MYTVVIILFLAIAASFMFLYYDEKIAKLEKRLINLEREVHYIRGNNFTFSQYRQLKESVENGGPWL